jgi:hypothetical protein
MNNLTNSIKMWLIASGLMTGTKNVHPKSLAPHPFSKNKARPSNRKGKTNRLHISKTVKQRHKRKLR